MVLQSKMTNPEAARRLILDFEKNISEKYVTEAHAAEPISRWAIQVVGICQKNEAIAGPQG